MLLVVELERDKANNYYGKLACYGAISTIVAQEMKATAPFLTKDMVKYHQWKLNKTERQQEGGAADTQSDELLNPSSTRTTANSSHSPHVDSSTISTLTNNREDKQHGGQTRGIINNN